MEPEIFTTTQQASPLLAYGTNRSPWNPQRIGLAVVAFGVLVISVVWALKATIRIPDRIPLLAVVRGGIPLSDRLPLSWRDAVSGSKLPVVLGVAVTDDGAVPFALAVGARTSTATQERAGALTFLSERRIERRRVMHLNWLLAGFARVISSPAFARIELSAIDPSFAWRIDARLQRDGSWTTDVPLPIGQPTELPPGAFSMNTDAVPEAWPLVRDALRTAGFDLTGSERPSSIGWTPTASSTPFVEMRFAQAPASSTIMAFAAAAGIFDTAPYRLPDGTVLEEFKRPTDPSNAWVGQVILSPNILATVPRTTQEQLTDMNFCTNGRQIALLRQQIIDEIQWRAGLSFRLPISQIQINEAGGRAILCIK